MMFDVIRLNLKPRFEFWGRFFSSQVYLRVLYALSITTYITSPHFDLWRRVRHIIFGKIASEAFAGFAKRPQLNRSSMTFCSPGICTKIIIMLTARASIAKMRIAVNIGVGSARNAIATEADFRCR